MGKKAKNIDMTTAEDVDSELQAEVKALLSIQQEKRVPEGESVNNEAQENIDQRNNYNKAAIMHALELMGTEALPFIESFQLCNNELKVQNQHDDLTREVCKFVISLNSVHKRRFEWIFTHIIQMEFYNHAIAAVNFGREKLAKLNYPTRRPLDYFCEHLKSDQHMAKVRRKLFISSFFNTFHYQIKDKLILEEKKMEAFELRKQREMSKKYHKQVTTMKNEERSQKAKNVVDAVTKLRKEKTGLLNGDLEGILKENSAGKSPGDKSLKRKRMVRRNK